MSTAPLLGDQARDLSQAAASLAGELQGRGTAAFAHSLAEAAAAFADSPTDRVAEARLRDLASDFVIVFASKNPLLQGASSSTASILAAAEDFLPIQIDSRDVRPIRKSNRRAFVSSACLLAEDLEETNLALIAKAYAHQAERSSKFGREETAWLRLAGDVFIRSAQGTPHLQHVRDLVAAGAIEPTLLSLFLCILRRLGGDANPGRKNPPNVQPTVEELREWAHKFAKSAETSSMADQALSFSSAVDRFVARKHKTKKETDADLAEARNILLRIASEAGGSDSGIALEANKMSAYFESILGSSSASAPKDEPSWVERLRAAMSGPELPIHQKDLERREKARGKRQVLFGFAIASPLVLLSSAKSTHIFPGVYGAWIGGINLVVWIFVSWGMLLNQFGRISWELQAAKHLSHAGMMGLAVLVCFYIAFAFFPNITWILWIAVAFAVVCTSYPWIQSCISRDEEEALPAPAMQSQPKEEV